NILYSQIEEIEQVVHVKQITNLFPIPVHGHLFFLRGCNKEPCQPTLVFSSKLPRSIDAALPRNDRAKSINPRVIPRVLVARTFRTAIWRMKIQRRCLVDPEWTVAVGVASLPF